jgi:hypothetical protein
MTTTYKNKVLTGSFIIQYARQSPLSVCHTPALMGMAKIKMLLTMTKLKTKEEATQFDSS